MLKQKLKIIGIIAAIIAVALFLLFILAMINPNFEKALYSGIIGALVAGFFGLINGIKSLIPEKHPCAYCRKRFKQLSEVYLCPECQKLYEDGEIQMIVTKKK